MRRPLFTLRDGLSTLVVPRPRLGCPDDTLTLCGKKYSGERTEWMECMQHRKRKETKQQPGTAGQATYLTVA